jgi:HK97 family phage major capsid protein
MTHAPAGAPEMKSGDAEIALAFDTFRRTFETFKADNDDRLAEIERKATADVVTVEKIDRINRALDEQKHAVDQLVLKNRRPQLGSDAAPSLTAIEHKAAFEAYMRGGGDDGLRRIEQKALSVAVPGDGGCLVPEETEREIGRRLTAASPIRAIAGVRQMVVERLQETLRHHRAGDRLGRRNRGSRRNRLAHPG